MVQHLSTIVNDTDMFTLGSEMESAERVRLKKSQDIADLKKKVRSKYMRLDCVAWPKVSNHVQYHELEATYVELKFANAELKRQAKSYEKQQAAAEVFAAKAEAYADSLVCCL